jgi:multisubunit Na+/H+ antiporter MnhF subunit
MIAGPHLAAGAAAIGLMVAALVLLWRLARGPSDPSRLLAVHGLIGVAAGYAAIAGLMLADHRVLAGAAILAVLGPVWVQALAARLQARALAQDAGDA